MKKAPHTAPARFSPGPAATPGRLSTIFSSAFVALFQRELRELLETLRARLSMVLVVVLMGLSGFLYAERFQDEVHSYESAVAERASELTEASVDQLANMLHPAIKAPWKLAFLVDGEQHRVPNVYRQGLSAWLEPELDHLVANPGRLPDSDPLDWLFVIRVVLSLAAFTLGYDAICGHRQQALLKMILSYSVPRWQVLSAKLAALWICLAVPLVGGAALSLALLTWHGGLAFSSDEKIKISLVLTLGLIASMLYLLFALLMSILAREPSRSLTLLALFWVMGVVVIPGAGGLLAHRLKPVPTQQQLDRALTDIRLEVEEQYGGPGNWRSPVLAAADDYAAERLSARTQNARFDRQEELRRTAVRQQLNQVEIARAIALPSMLLFQDLAERLVSSGIYRDRAFVHQVWAYREQLADYVRVLDGKDPHSPHIYFFPGYLSRQNAAAEEIPVFSFTEPAVAKGFENAELHLFLVTFMTLLLIVGAYVGFAGYNTN